MTIRIRTSSTGAWVRSAPAVTRRAFIYPHRSVRAMPPSAARFIMALLTVAAVTVAIASFAQPLLRLHNQLCLAMLQVSGIPINGVLPVQLFAGLGGAPVPMIAVPELHAHPIVLWTMVSISGLVLFELYRRIALARTLVVFLMSLLLMAAGVITFHPSSQFGSAEFATMWLRGELLVWLVVPWFAAGMFVLTHPNAWFGILWTILMQAYGFAWSAIRLAFGIAMMHYSGILFAPAFWFAVGFLADLIYVVVFYSVSVQSAARGVWGRRTQ
jgi:hypothetical protein